MEITKQVQRSWLLETVMAIATVGFVLLGSGTPLVVAVAVFGAGAALWAIRARFNAGPDSTATGQTVAIAAMVGLFIAIPVNRLPSAGMVIVVITAAMIALGLAGVGAGGARLPRGILVTAVLLLGLVFVTTVSTDQNALLRFALFAAASLPAFAVAGQMSGPASRRIARFIVTLGVLQSVLALVEVLRPLQLWAPAQLGSVGQVVQLINPLMGGGIERSQGTLGHPLALGFLLLISVAILARQFPGLGAASRFALNGILLIGIIASGSRSSLILAVIVLVFFSGSRISLIRAIVSASIAAIGVGLGLGSSWLSESAQNEFTDSGSYTHRVGAYDAVGKLLSDQDAIHVLFGNGLAATPRLFEAGLLQTDGFNVVDNQFILTLAQGGVFTLLLLLALAIGSLLLSPARMRPAVVAAIGTMLIFDTLNWPSSTILSFAIFAFAMNGDKSPSDLFERPERPGRTLTHARTPLTTARRKA